jgi:hypothetical protein
MPRANRPVPTQQLDLFPPPPGPHPARLPQEACETAARLMARMLRACATREPAGPVAGGRGND